jgi:hypothetical protein
MTTTDLKRAAAKHGGTVEDESGQRWKVYQCVSPEHRRWIEGGVHAIRVEWEPAQRDATWKDEVIADAIERMNHGTESCPLDCDCREEGE